MRHRKQKIHLGRTQGHRRALTRNLVVSLVLHERVRTTAAKARTIRPMVERCVHVGAVSSLATRRALIATLTNERAVAKILEVLGPRYRERPGGYTRTVRLGQRKGDAAPMVILEFV